ncbi:MAG: type II toxin-antitoxin system HicA family toxin [candidate division WOR-3 bacterium]|nr:type II toxin-antitoxin system HicA family toxin [candidate division WOR-3 bacterium]
MAPKLPQISGETIVALLRRLGYQTLRQRGSHVQLSRTTRSGEHRITIPLHRTLAKGTLNDILTRVAERLGISKEQLLSRL